MKKGLFLTLLLTVILSTVFYAEIIATKDFYTFRRKNPDVVNQSTISWKPINYTSASYKTTTEQPLYIRNLSIPVPFTMIGDDSTDTIRRVYSNSASLIVSLPKKSENFLLANGFNETKKEEACLFLSKTSGLDACRSNYNLERAFLEVNDSDVHVFSSIANKEMYNKILIVRANVFESNIISAFETNQVNGFLFTIDSNNYVAHVYDNNDERYTINFFGLQNSEVVFVLSNISVMNRATI